MSDPGPTDPNAGPAAPGALSDAQVTEVRNLVAAEVKAGLAAGIREVVDSVKSGFVPAGDPETAVAYDAAGVRMDAATR